MMSCHKEAPEPPMDLFKLKLNSRVREALCQVPEEPWHRCATRQTCQVAEGLIQLTA
jgi:hypothetical protein